MCFNPTASRGQRGRVPLLFINQPVLSLRARVPLMTGQLLDEVAHRVLSVQLIVS